MTELRWQCRRGMRELDELLLAYLDNRYETASDSDKQAFAALLELPDPELAGYLLNQQSPAAELHSVINQILDRSAS